MSPIDSLLLPICCVRSGFARTITIWHRTVWSNDFIAKSKRLKSYENSDWCETQLLVLLGIGTCLRADIQYFAAELACGMALGPPGEFFTPRGPDSLAVQTCDTHPSRYMRNLPPTQTRLLGRQVFVSTELYTCLHVFICVDSARKPIQQPYEGLFRVISRHNMTFEVDRLSRVDTTSIYCLKAAHVDYSVLLNSSRFGVNPTRHSDETFMTRRSRPLPRPAATSNEDNDSRWKC